MDTLLLPVEEDVPDPRVHRDKTEYLDWTGRQDCKDLQVLVCLVPGVILDRRVLAASPAIPDRLVHKVQKVQQVNKVHRGHQGDLVTRHILTTVPTHILHTRRPKR
jgi:hypothetical protein